MSASDLSRFTVYALRFIIDNYSGILYNTKIHDKNDLLQVNLFLAIQMNQDKSFYQLIWGWLLALAGVGVFFRVPQVMPKIEQIRQYAPVLPYIKFCLYLLGVILLGGGAKKIFKYYEKKAEGERWKPKC